MVINWFNGLEDNEGPKASSTSVAAMVIIDGNT